MLERDTVTYIRRITAINKAYGTQCKIFLVFVRRTYITVNHITSFQAIFLYLLRRYIYIVGRGQVVIVARTKETITIGNYLKYTVALDDV